MSSKINASQEGRSQLKTTRPISSYDNLDATVTSEINVSNALLNSTGNHHTLKDDNNKKMNGSKEFRKLIPHSQKQRGDTKQLNTNENNDNLRFDVRNNSVTSPRLQLTPTITTSTLEPPDDAKNIVASQQTSNKPVISDAKSKFFGYNNNSLKSSVENDEVRMTTISIGTESEEDAVNKSLLASRCKPITLISNNNSQQILSETPAATASIGKVCANNEKYSKNREPFEIQQQQKQDFSRSINFNKTGSFRSNSNEMDTNYPSQLVYMSTTVPQNIKGNDIAGRHTPTRNSLRHSRMLVVNKAFQGSKTKNPLGLIYPNLTRILLIHQVVFGTLLTCIGVWILLWAPNTRLQDNPYWSGITLTLAGILGLFVIRFKRVKRQKLRENCFVFLKYDSYLLTIIASALCLIALTCASIHLHGLSSTTTKCTSADILVANAACTCIFGVIESNTKDNSTQNAIVDKNTGFYYKDLSCNEVFGAWKFILTVSVILNFLGFCITILYIVSIFWKKRSKNMYSSVQTNSF